MCDAIGFKKRCDVIDFQVLVSRVDQVERQPLERLFLRRGRFCRIPVRSKIDVIESTGSRCAIYRQTCRQINRQSGFGNPALLQKPDVFRQFPLLHDFEQR